MLLQSLKPADLPACFEVFGGSVRSLAGVAYTLEQCLAWAPHEPWNDVLAASWSQRLSQAWGCKGVAEDGRLAGFAWLKHDGEFDMLYVAPWAGRQGVASRMIVALEARAAEHGVTALHTWASHASRPVFERAGYRMLRPNRIERNGVMLDNWLLAKGDWCEPHEKEKK